ncbi:MAG: thioredoxin family protein [Candidatus Micrarchaeota archaeon]|nr:TM0996/MTH895 family glutaredoxin-like protein [Candidatus Micrarchaeota archaeon]
MKIEILGSGCANCRRLEENAKKAVSELGMKIEISKVTDMTKIIEFGVMSTPAIAIDGKVKASGRIPDVKEIVGWLKE